MDLPFVFMWLRLRRPPKTTRLILGLGNIGAEYIGTRHNIGFAVLDALCQELEEGWRERPALHALVCEHAGREKLVLAKPTTFMNLSGQAAEALVRFYKPTTIIAVHDDADLPLGEVRVRPKGGSAGHNGVASLIEALGEEGFTRVRVGIGRPQDANIPLEDWVLGKWSEAEKERLPEIIARAAEMVSGAGAA